MIYINGSAVDFQMISRRYPQRGIEYSCASALSGSDTAYRYGSIDELDFELAARHAIVDRAERLRRCGLSFQTFRSAVCNDRYWVRRADGGFEVRRGASPSAAIRDIYENGRMYGTECATAMQLVYYGALLDTVPETAFDRQFSGLQLMNWHDISPALRETGLMSRRADYLPGDRRYFANPDVNLETPEWQGENVIDMGDGTFYGHGMGRYRADEIVSELNRNRRPGSARAAYLMNSAGRPDFERLFGIFGQTRVA